MATERGVMRVEGVLHMDTNALPEEKSVAVVEGEGHGDAEELRWVVIEKEGGAREKKTQRRLDWRMASGKTSVMLNRTQKRLKMRLGWEFVKRAR